MSFMARGTARQGKVKGRGWKGRRRDGKERKGKDGERIGSDR